MTLAMTLVATSAGLIASHVLAAEPTGSHHDPAPDPNDVSLNVNLALGGVVSTVSGATKGALRLELGAMPTWGIAHYADPMNTLRIGPTADVGYTFAGPLEGFSGALGGTIMYAKMGKPLAMAPSQRFYVAFVPQATVMMVAGSTEFGVRGGVRAGNMFALGAGFGATVSYERGLTKAVDTVFVAVDVVVIPVLVVGAIVLLTTGLPGH